MPEHPISRWPSLKLGRVSVTRPSFTPPISRPKDPVQHSRSSRFFIGCIVLGLLGTMGIALVVSIVLAYRDYRYRLSWQETQGTVSRVDCPSSTAYYTYRVA